MGRYDLPTRLVMSVPSPGMSINFAYLWTLARLQHGAYKKYKSDGPAALPDYNYDMDGAMFFGGMLAIAMIIGRIIVLPLLA